jgi:N-acetylglucosamine malate deacetylase 1
MKSFTFRTLAVTVAMILSATVFILSSQAQGDDGMLRIIAFGAHPDDCEIKAGGVAAKWAALGHHVRFVAVTNGDIGHFSMAGGALAQRRADEAREAAEILGIDTVVLDNHDGELLPTLENRKELVRLIREWKADIVLGPRTNDYHPDHRYTGILLQDAAFMVTVPFFCPDVPHLRKNPVFMYFEDRFQKPNAFEPDIVVSTDDVIDRKCEALSIMDSQFVERGVSGTDEIVPGTPEELAAARKKVAQSFNNNFTRIAERYRGLLNEWYGAGAGAAITSAEAFEICEYGRRPSKDELKVLFPFFEK